MIFLKHLNEVTYKLWSMIHIFDARSNLWEEVKDLINTFPFLSVSGTLESFNSGRENAEE